MNVAWLGIKREKKKSYLAGSPQYFLIGSRNSRCPRLLVDFEAEVKMTGSERVKNRKTVYIVLFL